MAERVKRAQAPALMMHRLRRNLGVLATGGAATAILGVAAVALNARALGPSLLGILALVQSYVVILGRTCSFDTWQGIVRFGAEAHEHGDHRKLVSIVSCAVLLDGASAAAAGITGIAALLLFSAALKFPPAYAGAAIFYASSLFLQSPGVPIGLMRLFDKFHWIAAINVGESAGRLIVAAALFAAHAGLASYIFGYATVLIAANLIRIAVSFRLLRTETGPLKLPKIAEVKSVARTFARFSAGSWITGTLNVTRRDGTLFVVAAILGPAGAGFYSVAQRIVQPIKDIAEMLRQALFPELSRLVAKNRHDQVTELVRRVLLYTVPLALLMILGALIFGGLGVKLIAGPGFGKAYFILMALAIASSLYLCMPLLSSLVILYSGMKAYTIGTAVAAVIWAALFVVPILEWHVRGAGVGEVIFMVSWMAISVATLRKSHLKRRAALDVISDPALQETP